MKYELRSYSFGQTLGKGLNLYFDNFLYIVILSSMVYLPLFYVLFFLIEGDYEAFVLIIKLVDIVAGTFISGFMINVVSQKYLGKKVSAKHYIFKNFALLLPLLGLSLLVAILIGLSAILLIVPGIIVCVGLSLSTQAFVIERTSIIKSLKRSWGLLKTRKWLIFTQLLILKILLCIVLMAMMPLIVLFIPDSHSVIVIYAVSFLLEPIIPCVLVVIYFNLRIEKEGFNVEHLAGQFSLSHDPE